MKYFNEIYQLLMKEDTIFLNLVIIIYTTIQTIVDMKIVRQLLDIETTKKQKDIWFFAEVINISICKFLLPAPVYKLVSIILFPIITAIVLKIDINKALIVQLIEFIIIFLMESLIAKSLANFMRIENYFKGMSIPLYRIIIVGTIIIAQVLVYKKLKDKKIVLQFPQNLKARSQAGMLLINIMGIACITGKFIELMLHDDPFHYTIFVIDTICIIITFFASIKHILEIYLVEKSNIEIERLRIYNQNLNELYDNIRCFKHDFSNIIQALGGYITTENLDGLKDMYEELLIECQENNKLSTLNPETINNPAVFNIINHKYQKAKEENIDMNIYIWTDLQKMEIKSYEFARMLGILLDNAIEAAKESKERVVDIKMVEEERNHRNLVIVRNTYDNKKIDMDKIFEKGYSTKDINKKDRGLGLWEIRKILHKNDNLNLFTTIEGEYFKQQLEIY